MISMNRKLLFSTTLYFLPFQFAMIGISQTDAKFLREQAKILWSLNEALHGLRLNFMGFISPAKSLLAFYKKRFLNHSVIATARKEILQ